MDIKVVTLDEEIDHHLKQGFREFSLALRAESEAARKGHLEMSQHHSDIVQRLRTQLDADQRQQREVKGSWL